MKVIIASDYDDLVQKAFEIVKGTVTSNPHAVLGLATGQTPIALYRLMVEDHKRCGTSYKKVRTFNLDEYKGLSADNPQSYAYYMRKNLFDRIDIDPNNTYIENGAAEDADSECKRYNIVLSEFARDIQLLGLGSNGHIAFNEPHSPFDGETHVVKLAESTLQDNSYLFGDVRRVPTHAYTMGIKQIMAAKRILILASGQHKADAVRELICGNVTESFPASVLQLHTDCTLIIDEAAGSKILTLPPHEISAI